MCFSKPAMPAKVADQPAIQMAKEPDLAALKTKSMANRAPAGGGTVLTGPMGAPQAPTGKVTLLGN